MATKKNTAVRADNSAIDQLRVDLKNLQGRKRQLQIETDNLVSDLDNLGGLDVAKAVAEASKLTSAIAGRKAVIKTLTSRIAESIEAIVSVENVLQAAAAAAKGRTDSARDKLHAQLWDVYEMAEQVATLSREHHEMAGHRNSGVDESPVHSLQNLLQDCRLGTQSTDGTFRKLLGFGAGG